MRPSHRCDQHRFFWAVLLLIAVDATLQEGSKPDSTSTPNDNPLMRRTSKSAVGKLEQEGLETSRSNPAAKMASVELNARGGDYHVENKTSSAHKDKDYVLMRQLDGALTKASDGALTGWGFAPQLGWAKKSILLRRDNGQKSTVVFAVKATCSSEGDCNGVTKWISKCKSSCDEGEDSVWLPSTEGACLVACENDKVCCMKTVTLEQCCEKEKIKCKSSCDDWGGKKKKGGSGDACGYEDACAEGKTCCTKSVKRCKRRCDVDDDDDED